MRASGILRIIRNFLLRASQRPNVLANLTTGDIARRCAMRGLPLLVVSVLSPYALGVAAEVPKDGAQAHESLMYDDGGAEMGRSRFPSAQECKQCHPDQYREWSVSPHAYAQLSPIFNAMQARIFALANGANGDFCIRCHTPVGMHLNESIVMANSERDPVSLEGVTCIVCHRRNEAFGKVSGRLPMTPGSLTEPIFGPKGSPRFAEHFGQEIDRKLGKDKVHKRVEPFFQFVSSSFCASCHDVITLNGARFEEAFTNYRHSPASRNGVTCQDCHMGVEPGKFTGDVGSNYKRKSIAKIGSKWVGEPRRSGDHTFVGPDHSVIHPGLFPHNPTAAEFASVWEWLDFDYRAGWGTDQFEEVQEPAREQGGRATVFPERWDNVDERYSAREIVEDQLAALAVYEQKRLKLLQAGYGLENLRVRGPSPRGLRISVDVKNLTLGHSVPTGFIGDRLIFLQVIVRNEKGERVFASGDLDPNFDLRDGHSAFVHAGTLPRDRQLFSLQSPFITRNVRGSESEQVLGLNLSVSPLPFLRPSRFSALLTGEPAGLRIHRKNIPPRDSRTATYKIPSEAFSAPGTYRGTVRLVAAEVSVNLVRAIQSAGFELEMSPFDVAMGVRFGVGDVVNANGEIMPWSEVERLVDAGEGDAIAEAHGTHGGHLVISQKEFFVTVP